MIRKIYAHSNQHSIVENALLVGTCIFIEGVKWLTASVQLPFSCGKNTNVHSKIFSNAFIEHILVILFHKLCSIFSFGWWHREAFQDTTQQTDPAGGFTTLYIPESVRL